MPVLVGELVNYCSDVIAPRGTGDIDNDDEAVAAPHHLLGQEIVFVCRVPQLYLYLLISVRQGDRLCREVTLRTFASSFIPSCDGEVSFEIFE